MYRISLSIIAFFVAIFAFSEEYNIVDSLNATEGVTIVQPERLRLRMVRSTTPEISEEQGLEDLSRHQVAKTVTYSVEVYADNSRQAEAQATVRRRSIEQRFPHYPAALEYKSPFWRVKVGHFTGRSDAEEAMAEIRKAFPSYAPYLRVVRNVE